MIVDIVDEYRDRYASLVGNNGTSEQLHGIILELANQLAIDEKLAEDIIFGKGEAMDFVTDNIPDNKLHNCKTTSWMCRCISCSHKRNNQICDCKQSPMYNQRLILDGTTVCCYWNYKLLGGK